MRNHDRSTYSTFRTAVVLVRSAWAITREPMPTPRHARQPFTSETPRSAR